MMKYKYIYYLGFVLISSLLIGRLSYATATIVLNTAGKPPLNNSDHRGFMDLVALEAFRRINVKLETVKLPAERALINANAGIIDGEMSRIAGLTNRYKNLIKVNEKIMDWQFVAYSNDTIKLEGSWDSLIEYTVSIINGWKILEDNIPKDTDLTKVKNVDQLFTMLKLKRTDIIIYEKWGGLKYIRDNNLTTVKLISPPLVIKEMFIYLNNKHQDLVPRLAAALKSMKQDGSYLKIKKQILTNNN